VCDSRSKLTEDLGPRRSVPAAGHRSPPAGRAAGRPVARVQQVRPLGAVGACRSDGAGLSGAL